MVVVLVGDRTARVSLRSGAALVRNEHRREARRMTIAESILPQYDHENATTRRLLERVPGAHLGWKPHQRSPAPGWLVGHIAHVPAWIGITLDRAEFEAAPKDEPYVPEPPPASTRELLARFDANVAAGRARLAAASDECMNGTWSLLKEGRTIFTMPRTLVMRDFILGHSIHHRGQLTVYLRMLDVQLPRVYGPTADEPF
jgi:uncharacterized damage-inducible protein DinB